jgi:hypothetical protein
MSSEAARKMQAQQFRDSYAKDFLNAALNQDIEQRIRLAKYITLVSSEKDDWTKYLSDLTELRNTKKVEIDNLEQAGPVAGFDFAGKMTRRAENPGRICGRGVWPISTGCGARECLLNRVSIQTFTCRSLKTVGVCSC